MAKDWAGDMTKSLGEILQRARPGLQAHWAECREADLRGHTPAETRAVNGALLRFVRELEDQELGLGDDSDGGPDEARILSAIKALFEQLHRLNAETGGGLLETDERELIVPLIMELASAAGLDLSRFEDGDPTAAFREF